MASSDLDQILALAARAATPNGTTASTSQRQASPSISSAITGAAANYNHGSNIFGASAGSSAAAAAGARTSPLGNIIASTAPITQIYNDNPNNCQPYDLAPPLPLNQYRLNEDHNPEIIRKKPIERVSYQQNVAVRYLRPPAPAPGGDIVIQQLPDRQVAPAIPLHLRHQQPSQPTPPPLIIREAPPPPPAPLPGQFHQIPGKIIPPPARKVINEYLPPCPAKPQQIIIDRWLPYEAPQQRVVYQPAKPPCLIPNPRNVTIIWSEPDVDITQEFVNLGVHNADPAEYVARYGASLVQADQLPEIAHRFSGRAGIQLAAQVRQAPQPILIGDVEYLRLIQRQ